MPTSPPAWRKSSFSGDESNCVEVAALDDGVVAVRNSNHPDQATLHLTRTQMHAWLHALKAGELDHHC